MTDHECGCSHFGPGPHDVDLRHPNPKACEHSEDTGGLRSRGLLANAAEQDIEGELDRLAPRADLDSIVDPSL